MVYVELDAAFRVVRAVAGSETPENAIGRYMSPERVIDVVRCGECKNWETDWEPCNFDPENPRYFCGEMDRYPEGDWFCSRGQRKTENVDRCVCCGEIIPEGRMVCPACERRAEERPLKN